MTKNIMKFTLLLTIFIANLHKFTESACFGYRPSTISVPGSDPRLILSWKINGQTVGTTAEEIMSFFQSDYPNFDLIDTHQFMDYCKNSNVVSSNPNLWGLRYYKNTKICKNFHCGYHDESGHFYVRSACDNYENPSCLKNNCFKEYDDNGEVISEYCIG